MRGLLSGRRGVGDEQFFAANGNIGNRRLSGGRGQPVHEQARIGDFHMGVAGRIDQHDAVGIEQPTITLDHDREITAIGEAQPGTPVGQGIGGHGLGRVFHDAPNIMHFGTPGEGPVLCEGMFFTIEPMINLGGWEVKMKDDGWTAVTRDKSLSAQFEHSLGVTADGVQIFTTSPKGLHKPPYD